MRPTETRINELHAEHREAYLKKEELERRGLPTGLTAAYILVGVRIKMIEAELSVLCPEKY